MPEFCILWGVERSHITNYHSQVNGIVELNNRFLGDSPCVLLPCCGLNLWDALLPRMMGAYQGTPHSATGNGSSHARCVKNTGAPPASLRGAETAADADETGK